MKSLYAAVSALAGPPLHLWTKRRIALGKDLPDRYPERFGRPTATRPRGAVVWAHAASLGESRVLFPVVQHMLDHTEATVLFTTATVTSAQLVEDHFSARVQHQFAPYDRKSWVNLFLDHWRPDLAIRAESEIWPHNFEALADRGTPLVIVNAKLRDRAARRWQMSGRLATSTFPAVSLALCQDEQSCRNLVKLGVKTAFTTGDLKMSANPLPCDPISLERLKNAIGDRPVWIAASTHGGEDPLVIELHQKLKAELPDVLTLIAPRHPDRGALIHTDATKAGLQTAIWSSSTLPSSATDIVVIDTIGELGLFYRAAQAAFVGKSLTGEGGQNPSEPALLERPVVFGPHMENFTGIAKGLVDAGGALQIDSTTALQKVLQRWLTDPTARQQAAAAGHAVASSTSTALDETLSRMKGYIDMLNERYE